MLRWRWRLVLALWTAISLFMVMVQVVQAVLTRAPIEPSDLLGDFATWFVWFFFFPLIVLSAQKFPFRRRHWRSWVAWNLALAVAVAVLYGLVTLVVKNLISEIYLAFMDGSSPLAALGRAMPDELGSQLSYTLFSIQWSLLAYFFILSVVHATRYFEKYRERELKASRLETQLVQSQLKMLKMQLHPHFLFNTLNAISALMHRDVDAADRMITLLSDLLRLSLEKDDRHQVALQDELAFLRRYLAIEEIRFRDRLKIRMDVSDPCLRAQVPKLILQPLVENSIRHGIAMRSAAGVVEISAHRRGNRLDLVVSDDGPGLPATGSSLREGVGLANTRARLEQLYGGDHGFELRNGRYGGFEVALDIPFEEEARFPMEGAA